MSGHLPFHLSTCQINLRGGRSAENKEVYIRKDLSLYNVIDGVFGTVWMLVCSWLKGHLKEIIATIQTLFAPTSVHSIDAMRLSQRLVCYNMVEIMYKVCCLIFLLSLLLLLPVSDRETVHEKTHFPLLIGSWCPHFSAHSCKDVFDVQHIPVRLPREAHLLSCLPYSTLLRAVPASLQHLDKSDLEQHLLVEGVKNSTFMVHATKDMRELGVAAYGVSQQVVYAPQGGGPGEGQELATLARLVRCAAWNACAALLVKTQRQVKFFTPMLQVSAQGSGSFMVLASSGGSMLQ